MFTGQAAAKKYTRAQIFLDEGTDLHTIELSTLACENSHIEQYEWTLESQVLVGGALLSRFTIAALKYMLPMHLKVTFQVFGVFAPKLHMGCEVHHSGGLWITSCSCHLAVLTRNKISTHGKFGFSPK